MTSGSETLGIDFSVAGLIPVLRAFADIERAALRAGNNVSKAFAQGGAKRQRLSPGNLIPISGPTSAPTVKGGTGTATVSGGMIHVNVNVVVAGGGGSIARQGGPALPSGPRSRLTALRKAIAGGGLNADQMGDAQDAADRISKRLAPAAKKTFGGAVKTALLSSRFGADGIMPLVSKTVEALDLLAPGLGAAGGAAYALGSFALKAGEQVYELANRAAEAANRFSQFAIATGSGAGTNAKLMGIAGAAGLDQSAITSISSNIQNSISGSPSGMAAGLRFGIHNFSGMYGSQDQGANTLKVMEGIRAHKDDADKSQLLGALRQLGAEALMAINNLSERQYQQSLAGAATTAYVNTPATTQASADFQAAQAKLSEAMANLMISLTPALPALTKVLDSLANAIDYLSKWLTDHSNLVKGAAGGVMGAISTGIGSVSPLAAAGFDLLTGQGSGNDSLQKSLDKNTAATKDNTAAMPGGYGNISRPGVAGDGMNGVAIRHAADNGGYMVSTF